jgi:hypothetical protein
MGEANIAICNTYCVGFELYRALAGMWLYLARCTSEQLDTHVRTYAVHANCSAISSAQL